MKIILSPAKGMKYEFGYPIKDVLLFPKQSKELYDFLSALSFDELKKIYRSSDKIVKEAKSFWEDFSFKDRLSPALFAYDGIAYTYMEREKLSQEELDYLEEHLFILSAFYGLLKPFSGVSKYRLELGQKVPGFKSVSLYDYWGDKLYQKLYENNDIVINLASEEYASIIRKHLKENNTFIDVFFYEDVDGKLVEKGVYCKMARGKLTSYLARKKITTREEIESWNEMNYHYSKELSDLKKIVFIRRDHDVIY